MDDADVSNAPPEKVTKEAVIAAARRARKLAVREEEAAVKRTVAELKSKKN